MLQLFTVEETANFLKKSIASVYSDIHRRPESLPPQFRAPGSRKVLFVDIEGWAKQIVGSALLGATELTTSKSRASPAAHTQQPAAQAKRKRGRPTHAEKFGSVTKGGA